MGHFPKKETKLRLNFDLDVYPISNAAVSLSVPLLKVLVPNYVAGALIGKAGSTIAKMQSMFGGSIKLSANRDFYPGTVERIVVLTGEVGQVCSLNQHIMEQVEETLKAGDKRQQDETRGEQTKIVLTNGAAGLLIGRAGATIKALQEATGSKINLTNRDDCVVHGERVLTVTGTMKQRTQACAQIIDKISQEPSNARNNNLRYLSSQIVAGNGGTGGHMLVPQHGGALSPTHLTSRYNTLVNIQMEIPDIMVGAILGKQGQTVSEIIQLSGAKLKFSGKDEYAPGTMDRILTISGDMKQAETAFVLVNQKVEQVHKELKLVENEFVSL